jgi:hypothetical protein
MFAMYLKMGKRARRRSAMSGKGKAGESALAGFAKIFTEVCKREQFQLGAMRKVVREWRG